MRVSEREERFDSAEARFELEETGTELCSHGDLGGRGGGEGREEGRMSKSDGRPGRTEREGAGKDAVWRIVFPRRHCAT